MQEPTEPKIRIFDGKPFDDIVFIGSFAEIFRVDVDLTDVLNREEQVAFVNFVNEILSVTGSSARMVNETIALLREHSVVVKNYAKRWFVSHSKEEQETMYRILEKIRKS